MVMRFRDLRGEEARSIEDPETGRRWLCSQIARIGPEKPDLPSSPIVLSCQRDPIAGYPVESSQASASNIPNITTSGIDLVVVQNVRRSSVEPRRRARALDVYHTSRSKDSLKVSARVLNGVYHLRSTSRFAWLTMEVQPWLSPP